MRDILHFSHANGFPAGSYQYLFEQLDAHYDVRTIERLGHHQQFPVTDNWHRLEQQLTHYFEQHYRQPVIAVGHSLGGVLSYMVARKRPDLVKALVMLDSPVLTPMQSRAIWALKQVRLVDYVTPAARTEGRRRHWHSKEEALAYFQEKSLMRAFDPRCLRDYVEHGTQWCDEQDPSKGVELRFDADIEMKIYRTIPHHLSTRERLAVPAAVIGGRKSNVFRPLNGRYMEKSVGMQLHWLDGGHMFPLEHPRQTADKIRTILRHMDL